MMSSTLWVCLLLLCETSIHVYGWGPVGHSTIVRLAQSQLTDTALEWTRSILPWHWKGNLSAMASWADDILYPNTNPTGFDNWQWSRPLHYVNIPDWSCDYHAERDCINDICAAGAIRNYTKQLETEFDHIKLGEALNFLIHYVGDIHQPLHTGFVGDRGGNDVHGHFMGTEIKLHALWDSGLIKVRVQRDFHSNNSLYYEHIHQLMLNQSFLDNDNNIDHWINENINFVCKQIYINENNAVMNSSVNFTLGEIYYEKNIPVVEQRLAQGGRRLGIILNDLAKKRPKKPSEKLCAGTIALIVILAVEFILAIIIGGIIWIRRKNKSSPSVAISFTPKKM